MKLQRLYEDELQTQAPQIRSDVDISMEKAVIAYDVTKIGSRLRMASSVAGQEAQKAGDSPIAHGRRGWSMKASFLAKKADDLATDIML
jgi:hypothetical protein